jgi:hypothetical protein
MMRVEVVRSDQIVDELEERMRTCGYCLCELEQHDGRGRPAVYCSTGCRRSLEGRLRRLVRRLEDIDDRIARCDLGLHGIAGYGGGDHLRDERAKLVAYRREVQAEHDAWIKRSCGESDARSAIACRDDSVMVRP